MPTENPIYKKWWFWVIVVIVISAIARIGEKQNQQTATQPQNQQEVKHQIEKTEADSFSDQGDGIIAINADALINAYRADEKSANQQYENKRVSVTGVISGIVTVPDEVIMRANQRGMVADAFFIAMGMPSPSSAQQAMQNSGVTAYFGQKHASISGQLARGDTVTVVCRCSGKMFNSIRLEDCSLQTQHQTEAAMDKPPY